MLQKNVVVKPPLLVRCRRPNYLPIDIPRRDWGAPRHYSLLLYREGWGKERKTTDVKGMPVLYIPGNAGSGRQVRSLAAQAADDFNSGKPGPELDFFAVRRSTPASSMVVFPLSGIATATTVRP